MWRDREDTGRSMRGYTYIYSPRCKGRTFASCRLSTEEPLQFLHPQYPTAEEPASKCKVRKLHLDMIELLVSIFLHLTKTLCRKRLCLIVPYLLTSDEDFMSKALVFVSCVSSYRWVHFPRAVLFCQPHQQLFTHTWDTLRCTDPEKEEWIRKSCSLKGSLFELSLSK